MTAHSDLLFFAAPAKPWPRTLPDIRLDYWPKPIPDRRSDWSATDANTYDGAEDSGNRHQVGYGATAAEALGDLLHILSEDAELTPRPVVRVALAAE